MPSAATSFPARAEAGAEFGRRVDQFIGAEKPPPPIGHPVVDRTRVGASETVPHGPQETVHELRARCLSGIPLGFLGPAGQDLGAPAYTARAFRESAARLFPVGRAARRRASRAWENVLTAAGEAPAACSACVCS